MAKKAPGFNQVLDPIEPGGNKKAPGFGAGFASPLVPTQQATNSTRLATGAPANADLENYMATQQSKWELAGKSIGQTLSEAVLGTIEAGSYLADVEQMIDKLKGDEQEYTNWLADAMKEAKEAIASDILPVHKTFDAQEGFAPGDATWWAANTPQTIGTALSLMIPAAGVAGVAAKGAKVLGASSKGINLTKGLSATLASRYAESTMEANNLYERSYNELLGQGVDDQTARLRAGEAASKVWNSNWVFAVQDFFQYNSILKGFGTAAKGVKGLSVGELIKQGLSEAGEEAGQFIVSEEAHRSAMDVSADYFGEGFSLRLHDYIRDPEFKASTLLGAVGGGVFTAAGPIANKIADTGQTASNFLQEQVQKITKKGVQKEVANYNGDTATSMAIDDETFAQQVATHIVKGTLPSLRKDYEALQGEENLSPEVRDTIATKLKDLEFIQNEQARLKGSSFIPSELHNDILFTKLEQRNLGKIHKTLTKEIDELTKEAIDNKELNPNLAALKEMRLRVAGYQELAKTNPEFQSKVDEAQTALNDQLELAKIAYPNMSFDLITTNDEQLIQKYSQLISTDEKINNLKKDLVSFSTKEGIENLKKIRAAEKINREAEAILEKADATKEELLQAHNNATDPNVKAKINERYQQKIEAERKQNTDQTNREVLEAQPDEFFPEMDIDPDEFDPDFFIPPDEDVEFDPDKTIITQEYGGLTFNQVKKQFGADQANKLLERLQAETPSEQDTPKDNSKKKKQISSQSKARELGTVPVWLKVRGGKFEKGQFIPSETTQKYYDNINNREVDVTNVFATDEQGHLLIDTPHIQVGEEVILKVVDNGKNLQFPFTLTPGFRPNKHENVVINGYRINENGELYGKPLFQLPSADNRNVPNREGLVELRNKVIANGTFKTKITSKSIGDFRKSSTLKSLEILEFDYSKDTDGNWVYDRLKHNPIFVLPKSDGRLVAPNLESMSGITKEEIDAVDTLLELPIPDEYSEGAIFTPRTTPDGSKRLAMLKPKKLTDAEIEWVNSKLGKKLADKSFEEIEEVLYIPQHFASFLTGTKKEKKPGITKASRRRLHLVSTTENDAELLVPVKNRSNGWIVLKATGEGSQVSKFLAREPFNFDIITEKGERISVIEDSSKIKPETLKNIYDTFDKLIKNSFRNVKETNLNSEILYTDPVTGTEYENYYKFITETDAIQTDLPGSKTISFGEGSSYSFENAGLHLDPKTSQVEVHATEDEIESIENIEPQPAPDTTTPPSDIDPIEEYYGFEGKPRRVASEGFSTITDKELSWFKDTFGEEFLSVAVGVDRIITEGGIEAFGIYHNALVTIADLAETGTLYHEAFHFALDKTVSRRRKEKILAIKPEEDLAEEFRTYMLSDGKVKPKEAQIKGFFANLWNMIKNLLGLKGPIERLFKDISSTQLTQQERERIKAAGLYSEPKYRLLPGFKKYVQQEDAILATAHEVLSLARETALQNDLDFTDLLTKKSYLDLFFLTVKDKFTKDYHTLIGKQDRSLEEEVRVRTYTAMGIGQETGWEDTPGELQPTLGFKSEVLRSLSKFGFRVQLEDKSFLVTEENESEGEEEQIMELKEQDEGERIHDLDHTLVSPTKTLSTRIKLFLSTIPEPNIKEGKVEGIKKTIFGTPKYIDFNRAYSNLSSKLADSEIPLVRLEELSEGDPISKVIFDRLSQEIKDGNTKLQNEFNTKFNLTTYVYTSSIHGYSPKKGFYAQNFESDRANARKTILNEWRQESIRKNLIETDGTVVPTKAAFLKKKVDAYANLYRKAKKDRSPLPYEDVKKEFNLILKDIGVTLPPQVWTDLELITPQFKVKNLENWFFGLNSASLQNLTELASKGIDPYSQRTILDILAIKSKDYMDNLRGSQFLNEFNNQVYATNTPSYLTETIDKFKNSDFIDQLTKDKFLENNHFLKALKTKEGLSKLSLEFISADRQGDKEAKDFSKRTPKDSSITRLNYFFNNGSSKTGKFFIGTFSDKTKQAVLGLPKYQTPVTALNFLKTVLKDTVNQEAQRIQKVKKYKGIVPELDAFQRGEEFVYINELNSIPRLAESLYAGEISPEQLRNLNSQVDSILTNFINNEYEKFVNTLVNNGTISRNEKGEIENEGIPEAILQSRTVEGVLKEFFYNDLAYRIETGKVFMGDAALYKSNVDYYKRQYQLVTPGLKPFNNPESPTTLTRVIYNSVIKVNADEYLDSLRELFTKDSDKGIPDNYKAVNKTDAQSFTTIHGAKKLMEAQGVWTEAHEELMNFAWGEGKTINEAAKEKKISQEGLTRLKSLALSVTLQPFKPFQYNDRAVNLPDKSTINIKEQFKDSIAVLVPEFTNRHTEYRKLLNYMRTNSIDIMSAEDSSKVGTYGVITNTDIEENIKPTKVSIRPVSLSDIRLPQIMPDTKKEAVLGTQFNKKITSNISSSGTYKIRNKSIKGSDLIKEWNALWNEKISNDSAALLGKLGLTNFTLSQDPKKRASELFKIKTVLEQELLARDLNDNFSDALELIRRNQTEVDFTLHLGFPTHSKKFSSLVTNLFKKNILKQKLPGFSMINLADYGNPTTERNSGLEFIRNESGEIVEAEVGLPIDFFREIGLNYIEHTDPITNKIRWEKLNEGQKRALQMILYRIPTSDKSSMIPVRVAMIIPPSMGNVVMIPGELTAQQGLDFDVDKSQLLRRVLNKEGKPDNDNLSNKIFDIAWSVLTSKHHIAEMLNPLGSPTLVKIKKEYSALPDPLREGNIVQEEGSSNFLSTVSDLEAEEKNKHAKAMIGIFSRFSTAHDLIQTIPDHIYVSPEAEINIKSNNPKYKYNQLGRKEDSNGNLISRNITEDQSAALDAAKDPILADLNTTTVTAPLKGYLTMMGLPPETVSDFMMQPILREWMRMYNREGGSSQEKALEALLLKYPDIKEQFEQKRKGRGRMSLDSESLAKTIIIPIDNNTEHQSQVLFDFVKYMSTAATLSKISNVLSVDTFSDLSGVEALQSIFNQVEEVTDESNTIYLSKSLFNLEKAPKEAKRLAAFYKYGVQDALTFSKEFFPYGNRSYQNAQSYLGFSLNINPNKELLTKINTFTDYYMMEVNGKVAPVLNKIAPNYISRWSFLSPERSIWKYVEDLIQKYPSLKNNGLIQSLENYSGGQEGVQMIGVVNTNKNSNKSRITQGWWDLLTAPQEEIKTLGADLVRFAIYTSGFGYNTRSFIDLVPVQFWTQHGIAEEHRMLLSGLLPNEEGESATRIDAEGVSRSFIRHMFNQLERFPEVYYNKTKNKVSTLLINVKGKEHVTSFSLPGNHPLVSFSEEIPHYVRLWDKEANKYRLYESSPNDKYFFKEVQPLGEAKAFFEVTYDGRNVSKHPDNKDSGSPDPFKGQTREFPLLGEIGTNPYIGKYIDSEVTSIEQVLNSLEANEVNVQNKEVIKVLKANLSKIDTPVQVVEVEGALGVFETDGEASVIKINPNGKSSSEEEFRTVLLHEINHAYSTAVLQNPTTEREINFSRNIERVRLEAKKKLGDINATSNKYEFIATLASSAEFRKSLKKTGFWDRVLRFFRKLLGQKEEFDKILDEYYSVLDNSETLQNYNKSELFLKAPQAQRKRISLLEQIMSSLKARESRLRKQGKKVEAKSTAANIKTLEELAKNKKNQALVRYLLIVDEEVQELKKSYGIMLANPEKINSEALWGMIEQLVSYDSLESLSNQLRADPEAYAPTKEASEEMIKQFDSLKAEITKLSQDIRRLRVRKAAEILKAQSQTEESITELIDQLEIADRDISWSNKEFDAGIDMPDTALQTIHSMIKNAEAEADRLTNEDMFNKETKKEELVYKVLTQSTTQYGDPKFNKDGSPRMYWKAHNLKFNSVGLAKALDEYEAWLKSKGKRVGSVADKFSPIIDTSTLSENDNGVEFINPISKEGKAILNISETSPDYPLRQFYETVVLGYLKSQEKIKQPSLRPGVRVPTIQRGLLEAVTSEGLTGFRAIKERVLDSVRKRYDETDFRAVDENGKPLDYLPIRFISKQDGQKGRISTREVSLDIATSVGVFMNEMHRYGEMEKILADLELIKGQLEDRKVINATRRVDYPGLASWLTREKTAVTDPKTGLVQTIAGRESNTYKAADTMMRRLVYGQFKKEAGEVKIGNTKFDVRKTVDSLIKFTGFRILFGNIAIPLTNLAMGELTMMKEMIGGNLINRKNYLAGQKFSLKVMGESIEDLGRREKKTKIGRVFTYFNPMDDARPINSLGVDTNWMRTILPKLSRGLSNATEFKLASSAMGAVFDKFRATNAEGKEVSLYDALKVDMNGTVSLEKGFKYKGKSKLSAEDINEVRDYTLRLYQYMNGIYNKIDSPGIKESIWGELLMFMRNWLKPGINTRWQLKRYDKRLKQDVEGHYISAMVAFNNFFNPENGVIKGTIDSLRMLTWLGVSDPETLLHPNELELSQEEKDSIIELRKANIRKTLVELYLVMGMTMIMMSAWGDDDDSYPLYMLARIRREMLTFVSPTTAWDVLRSPSVALRTVEDFQKIIWNTMDATGAILTGEQLERYKSGPGKGQTKLFHSLKPILAIDQLKDLDTKTRLITRGWR